MFCFFNFYSLIFSCQFWVVLCVRGCLQASVENIMKDKMPKKGGRWWFSWRSRSSDSKSVSTHTGRICLSTQRDKSWKPNSLCGSLWPSGVSDRDGRSTRYSLSEQVTSHFKSTGVSLEPISAFRLALTGSTSCFLGWRMNLPLVMRTTECPIRRQDSASLISSSVQAACVTRRLFASPQSSWYVCSFSCLSLPDYVLWWYSNIRWFYLYINLL